MSEDFRPLGIGELVDRAALVWRANFKGLFFLSLGFQMVQYVITKAGVLTMYRLAPAFGNASALNELIKSAGYEQFLSMAKGISLMAVAFLLGAAISWLGLCAGSRYVGASLTRPVVSTSAVVRESLAHWGSQLGTFVIVLVLWFVAGSIILAVCGGLMGALSVAIIGLSQGSKAMALVAGLILFVVMFIGLAAAVLAGLVQFLMTPAVLAIEETNAVNAIARSLKLMAGRIGPRFVDRLWIRASIVVTIVGIIVALVTVVAGIPALVIQSIFGHIFSPGLSNTAAIPQVLLVPAELLQVAGQAAFFPLAWAVATLFYIDVRVRREGLDLEMKLA